LETNISEAISNYHNTQSKIPEKDFYIHHHENLKSHTLNI